MEIRLLEYFMVLSQELHYTKSAEKLGISQPTLSQQIRLLESKMGVKLFQQKGKKIYITDAGRVLLRRAERIFYELDQASKEIEEINELKRGRLTIGCSGNHLLHSSILTFHEQFPNIELSVVDSTTEETVACILNSTFDLGVVFLPVHDDRIESKHLFTSELFLICSKDHDIANTPSTSLKQMQEERVFLLQKNYLIRRVIDHYCKETGKELKPLVELSDTYSLLEMTVKNNGVTILPKSYVEKMNDNRVILVRLEDPLPKKEVGVVYQKNAFTPSASEAFIEHLLENYLKE
ncbi:LysR family transcriptional regulator [Alteribacillus sp. JSM 102045]|uniref:LysR family transcriptional regulator n=1 Tax=Alteribacillus sp. JSM 102045 TaxID=1562101 RepID=UPI0035C0EA21